MIFDIDGTLADATHRLHHVTGGRRDWDAFFAEMADDVPVKPICDLLVELIKRNTIVICSGRPERSRGRARRCSAQSGRPGTGCPATRRRTR